MCLASCRGPFQLATFAKGKAAGALWRLLRTVNTKNILVGHNTLYCSILAKIELSSDLHFTFPYYLRKKVSGQGTAWDSRKAKLLLEETGEAAYRSKFCSCALVLVVCRKKLLNCPITVATFRSGLMGFFPSKNCFPVETNRSDDGDGGDGLLAAEFSNRQQESFIIGG